MQHRLTERQVLWLAFALNAGMFIAESTVGWLIGSASLLADSLDMFADAAVYGLSLYALTASCRRKAETAAINAWLHIVLAVLLAVEVLRCTISDSLPQPLLMSVLSVAAMLVNASCVLLLHRFRRGDINLRASWICSRNDLIGNLAVLVAAALVSLLGSAWPDRVVGLAMAAIMLHSSLQLAREAWQQRQQAIALTAGS